MAPFDRRDFSGNSVPTTITSTISPADLTISIASSTGWPDGDVGPFIVTIDKGLATEEKIEVASRTGLVLTVTPTGRGHDNTAGVGHGSGAPIEHTMAARDLQEANQHIADDTLDHHSQYLTSGRHAGEQHAIDTVEIVDGSVTYPKLAAGQRWEPGDFKWGIQAADHAGWLICDGGVASIAGNPGLWAAMGSAHIFGVDPGGGNFRRPDLRKKTILGKTAAGFGSTLGAAVGSADGAVVAHSHTVNSHSHGGATGGEAGHVHNANHGHTADDNDTGNHDHSVDGDFGTRVVISHGGGVDRLNNAGGGTQVPILVSTIDANGTHNHNITVNANNFNTGGGSNHTHGVGAESPGTNSIGVAATDANIPPALVLNGFIHV